MDEKVEVPAEDDLVVSESADGTVVVEGVDSSEPEQKADGGQVEDDGGEDHPDDTEAIRASRREKRKLKKQYHRQQQHEKDIKYNQLLKQNQELTQRLSLVEQKTHGTEIARIDKAIEDQDMKIQWAKMKMSEATSSQDGNAMAEAQEVWFEARRASEALSNLKRQSTAPRPQANLPDPTMQRLAANWMEKNPWYDPSNKDEDSEIALTVDKRMAKEGWDPRSPEYWEELDNRLQNRLPHRYNETSESNYVRKPRSVVTGSGRESVSQHGGKVSVTLPAEYVKNLKDAGMWDNAATRKKMINSYVAQLKTNRS